MRRALVSAALLVATLSTAGVSMAAPTTRPVATLGVRVPSVEFKDVALVDFVEFLRDAGALNVRVDWAALEAAGVDRSTPLSLKLRGLPLAKVLDLGLRQVGGNVPLAWYVADEVVEITTRELADRVMVTRVYPVHDLIVDVPDFAGPSVDLQTSGNAGGGGDQGMFRNQDDRQNEAGRTAAERGEQLVRLIVSTVRPEVWVENGGTARVRFFNGNLIVTAPRDVQRLIGG